MRILGAREAANGNTVALQAVGTAGGPLTPAQLKRLADSGQLSPTDLVWKEGLAQWVPAGKVRGLFPVSPPAAVPPEPSGDESPPRAAPLQSATTPMSLLTINTMGSCDERNKPFISGDLQPCIAVYAHGSVPRIVKLVRPGREPAADARQATDAAPVEPEAADSSAPAVKVEQADVDTTLKTDGQQ